MFIYSDVSKQKLYKESAKVKQMIEYIIIIISLTCHVSKPNSRSDISTFLSSSIIATPKTTKNIIMNIEGALCNKKGPNEA